MAERNCQFLDAPSNLRTGHLCFFRGGTWK
jgi:hypothetical protein